jgi:L-lactate utilization protein LutC
MSYTDLAPQAVLDKTLAGLASRNIKTLVAANKTEALAAIQALIPAQAKVMTGSSTTLDQIGFVELLKSGNHPWNNLKDAIMAETDQAKQAELRRQSVLAEYFLGSVHAVTEDGIALIASASGSQLPSYAFTSDNVIWVVGAQKIVPNLDEAFKRVKEHVFPLEDARMKSTGAPGSIFGKWLIFEREVMPRNVHMIIVNEVLGF